MAGGMIIPTIVPSSIFGANAPSNKINVAQIGFGRIAMGHDLAETLPIDLARVIAVATLIQTGRPKASSLSRIFMPKERKRFGRRCENVWRLPRNAAQQGD